MPTYGYRCEKCQHTLDVFQKITDEELKQCPKCHQLSLKRTIGGGLASFQFLGEGFYETDYKKKPSSEKEVKKSCGCGKKHCGE